MGVAGTNAGGYASDVYESSGDLYAVSGGDHDILRTLCTIPLTWFLFRRGHKPDVKNRCSIRKKQLCRNICGSYYLALYFV